MPCIFPFLLLSALCLIRINAQPYDSFSLDITEPIDGETQYQGDPFIIQYTADTGNWTLCLVEMDIEFEGGDLAIGRPQRESSYSSEWTPPLTLRGECDFGLTAHLGYSGCELYLSSTTYIRQVTLNVQHTSYVYQTVTQTITPSPIITYAAATTTLPASTFTPQTTVPKTQTLVPTIVTTVISGSTIDVTSYVSVTSTIKASTYTQPLVSLEASVISSTAPATTVTASVTPVVTSSLLTVVPSGYTMIISTTGSVAIETIVQDVEGKGLQANSGASPLQPITFLMSCIVMLSLAV